MGVFQSLVYKPKENKVEAYEVNDEDDIEWKGNSSEVFTLCYSCSQEVYLDEALTHHKDHPSPEAYVFRDRTPKELIFLNNTPKASIYWIPSIDIKFYCSQKCYIAGEL